MWKGVPPGRLSAALSLLLAAGSASAADCNRNDVEDWLEITGGSLPDCNGNGIPDPCDLLPVNYTLAARGAVPMGLPVSAAAASDLDGDGDLDIAAAHPGFLSATVIWNLGEGIFSPPTRLRGASPTSGVAAGDIDGDGKVDLAVTTDEGFLFLVNRGSRHFSSRTLEVAPVNRPLRSAELADLDGDGDLDIAATAPFKVVVLLNPGDGSFSAQASIPVGSNPVALTVARMDGDADLDIVTANHLDSDQSGNVSVLLNDGSGTFGAARNFGVASGPIDVAAGDLDGDGDADVVVACFSVSSVCVLLGAGDGALTGGQDLPQDGLPISVSLADLDGDRDLDLASTLLGRFEPGNVSVLLNHGKASFARALEFPTSFQPTSPILTADLTGDGDLDIAAGLDIGTLLILERAAAAHDTDCDGSGIPDACELPEDDCNRNRFLDECDIATGESRDCNGNREPDECELDCNANGTPDDCDLAASTSADCNQNDFPDECDIGPPVFRFDASVTKAPGNNIVLQLQSEDLDRDGRMDVFGFQPAFSAVVFWNEGSGAFGPPIDHGVGLQVNTVGAGDVGGDEDLDLVVGDVQQSRLVVLTQEDRSFSSGATIGPVAFPVAVALGDIDQDGDLDVVATDGSRAVLQFFSNSGDGGFTPLGDEVFSPMPHLLHLADVDRDGWIDLLMVRPETGLPGVFWNDTAGSFRSPTDLGGRTTPAFAATPDMDGDGDLDIVAGVFDGFTISIQDGPRSFRTIDFITPLQLPSGFRAEDLDGDGDADIAAPALVFNTTPALAVFRNRGGATFDEASLSPIELLLGSVTSGDYDGDGKPDVVAAAQPFCFDGGCVFEPSLVSFRNRTHPASSLDADGNNRPDECDGGRSFRRGDSSGDGNVDVADAVFTLLSLFRGGPAAACAETADSDNDGRLSLADPVLVLDFLFRGGPPPAPPGTGACGLDPDPDGSPGDLGCGTYDSC